MSAYSDLILAHANLRVYYRMGESSGTVLNDAQTSPVNGVINTSGATFGATGALANDADTALLLDQGHTNPLVVTDPGTGSALDFGDGPLSWEIWFKRTATQGAVQSLMSKGTNAGQVQIDAGNYLTFNGPSGALCSANVTTTDQVWHHVVVTKNGTARVMYLDGVDVTVLGTNQTLADTNTSLRFGWLQSGTQIFPGSLDEIALYNAVLSADEVLQHYRTALGAIVLTDTATTSDAQAKDVTAAIADSVTSSEATVNAPEAIKDDSVTTSDADAKDVTTAQADAVTPTDTQSSEPGVVEADSVTTSDATSTEPGLVKADSVTATDDQATETGVGASLSDSVTADDAQARDIGANPSDTATLTDAVALADELLLGDSATTSDAIASDVELAQADSVTATDDQSAETGTGVTLTDDVTLTDAAAIDAGVDLTDQATVTDDRSAEPGVVLDDAVTADDAIAPELISQSESLSDSITVTDSLFVVATEEGAGTGGGGAFGLVRVPVVVKELERSFSDVVALTDALETELARRELNQAEREQELMALI